MRVFAFVGPSGTGKSYRALWVAKQNNINYIIDDGLLIGNNKVIAGTSAKKELTKVGAIKRACFYDQAHIKEVQEAINVNKPDSILIIGTSEEMADTIRKALELEKIEKFIHVKDVATEEEIKKAQHIRKTEGKHVIPVPTFEIKKNFSGYFIDKLNIFQKKENMQLTAEKTIVRPAYSYLGSYTISENVLRDIIAYVLSKQELISRVHNIDIRNRNDGITIDTYVTVKYAKMNKDVFKPIQNLIRNEIERLTYMNVLTVNIYIKSLSV